MHNELSKELSTYGIPAPPKLITHDKFTRWGKNKRYWAKSINDGYVFGDYSKGISTYWFPDTNSILSSVELVERNRKIKEASEMAEKERLEEQLTAAAQAQVEYESYSSDCSNSQYLKDKKIKAFGIKYYNSKVVIPACDVDGRLWTYQTIADDSSKFFKKGGRKKGCFYTIGDIANSKKIYVCEGYATAASVFMATDVTAIVAFDSGNIEPVINAIKQRYPHLEIVIAGDNDRWKEHNSGMEAAEKATLMYGIKFYLPEFRNEVLEDLKAAGEKLPTDFNDLHLLQGIDEVKSQLKGETKWESPIAFSELETPEIPITLLPENLQEYAASLTQTAEVSSGMVVASILGVLSTALCKKFVVSPKDCWNEPVNIYTLVALPPASNKSLIAKNTTFPLIEWEKEQYRERGADIKKLHSKRKSEEKLIEGLRAKLPRCKDNHEQETLMREIADKEANLSDLEFLPKLYGNNFTPESLADDVFEQGGKFAIISDEGGVMETLSGLYSSGNANVDIILKGIDGGDARIRRKLFNYNINPYLTFLLVVQPQILMNMSSKKAFTGNGLLERFLYVIPKSNLGYRTHETDSVPHSLKEQYGYIIHELLDLPQSDEPIKLTLCNEAKVEWRQFQKAIEHQLRPGGKLETCVGWGGKISGFALRLAGLIHVCETLGKSHEISANAMNKALELAALLCEHAVAAFIGMGSEQSVNDAKDILKWLESLQLASFTKSEVVRALKNKACGKSERLDKALRILAERHYISEPISKSTPNSTKPTTYFEIHPLLQEVA